MRYLKRFNEGITLDEYNRILDKISDLGLNSLTKEERSKLDNFDGTFDKDKNNDVIITTDHGSWKSNDINPKYLPDNDVDKDSVYKDSTNSKGEDKNNKRPGKRPIKPIKPVNLNSSLSSRWNGGKGFHVLYKDNDIVVLLEKYIIGVSRVYYVLFKKMQHDNDFRVLKLEYNLNKGDRRDNSHIKFTDNNNNVIPFNKLDSKLEQNGLTFGDFNNAWYYIEEDFINK